MISLINNQSEWDALVQSLGGHPLQLWAWGQLKETHGPWEPLHVAVYPASATDAAVAAGATSANSVAESATTPVGAALVLRRRLPGPFNPLLYVPRGPACAAAQREWVLQELVSWAQTQRALELKLEPDWPADDCPQTLATNLRVSPTSVLLARTLVLDLTRSIDELLADATKRARQYIRNSSKHGITVRRTASAVDLDACLVLYRETAQRAGFGIHVNAYYEDLLRLGGKACSLYLAEKEGRPLAFLWNLVTPAVSFELYGGMNEEGSRAHANYALKWQAICDARDAGVLRYDLNGLLNDGVSQFKLTFSNTETLLAGAWDLPLSPLYGLWERALPAARSLMRRFR